MCESKLRSKFRNSLWKIYNSTLWWSSISFSVFLISSKDGLKLGLCFQQFVIKSYLTITSRISQHLIGGISKGVIRPKMLWFFHKDIVGPFGPFLTNHKKLQFPLLWLVFTNSYFLFIHLQSSYRKLCCLKTFIGHSKLYFKINQSKTWFNHHRNNVQTPKLGLSPRWRMFMFEL